MNTLHIKIRGADRKSMPRIAIDGDSVKCVKNEFGSYEATVQTARPEAEICVYSLLELRLPLWWLYALISFVVSVFGIFNPPYNRACLVPDVRLKVMLAERTDLSVILYPARPQQRAAEFETNMPVYEAANVWTLDRIARRRRRILLAFKIVVWLVLAFVAGYFLAKAL